MAINGIAARLASDLIPAMLPVSQQGFQDLGWWCTSITVDSQLTAFQHVAMATVLLQSDSEEKLRSVIDFAQKQGVVLKTFFNSANHERILRGGDGQSVSDIHAYMAEIRRERN